MKMVRGFALMSLLLSLASATPCARALAATQDPNDALKILSPELTCSQEKSEESAWARAGFGNPDVSAIVPDLSSLNDHELTNLLPITLVLFRNSAWTTAQVEDQFQKTAAIFASCGILLKGQVVVTDAPSTYRGASLDEVTREEATAAALPHTQHPVAFFVQSVLSDGPVQDPDIHFAHAWVRGLEDGARQDTTWVGKRALEEAPNDPLFSPLAHELGHLLGQVDHVLMANLMAGDGEMLNAKLSPFECKLFKSSPLVRALQ